MKKSILLLALSSGMLSAVAQTPDWIRVWKSNAGFAEKQKAFEEYWGTRNPLHSKGSGIKQYKRWEWFMQNRLAEDGSYVKPEVLLNALAAHKGMPQSKSINSVWKNIGPLTAPSGVSNTKGIGRINAVAFHPTDSNTIYAAAPSGGLWISHNGGQSWESNFDFLNSIGTSDIVINPLNPQTLYVASGDRDAGDSYSMGVLKSTDGGNTWGPTGLSFGQFSGSTVTRLLMNPLDTNMLYAATTSGISKSTDAGATWTSLLNVSVEDMEFVPGHYHKLYAVTDNDIRFSSDAGATWTIINNGFPAVTGRMKLAVTPADSMYAYVVMANGSSYGATIRTTDQGQSWTQMHNFPNLLGYDADGLDNAGQAWYDLDIAVSNTDRNFLIVGGVNIWRSTNGGSSFQIIGHWTGAASTPYVHADIHHLAFHPITNRMWTGCDGGVFEYQPNSQIWLLYSNGMAVTQFYRLSTSNLNPNIVVSGSQDNGSRVMRPSGWMHGTGGDGMEAMTHPTDADIMYTTYQFGSLNRSDDGGFSFVNLGSPVTGPWITPYTLVPQSPDLMYGGFDKVYQSADGGFGWTEVSPVFEASADINCISVCDNSMSVVYASSPRRIYISEDFGNNWTNITSGLPVTSPGSSVRISYIAVDDWNPKIVYVTLSGYSAANKVFKSMNGGQTWQNITLNLPNVSVNCIETERSAENGLFIGTDLGVYFTDKTMSQWEVYGDSLPNVAVTELEVTPAFARLRASTYGRGIWEIPVQNTIINTDPYIGLEPGEATEITLNLFPNPTSESVTLYSDQVLPAAEISIYGIDGKKVYTQKVSNIKNHTLDVSGWRAGLYTVEILSGKDKIRKKLVVK